ncbi:MULTISPECIES: SufE family protein [Bartonella]|uniref:Cysteine desulfuration protein SufE n=1 Tax=Bartonella choladocola TaxID=2750995 RepID=A0A1U9MGW4_9HYPH|nr:SufE family protein [Bartonella choladocola]AQT46881.1 Cysteine desulfuration protein SufE [Bartonella choladocola]MBH9974109.1 SufE family protein [Bartonella choladocola]MBI0140238.1 SufE family protein [Bartonella choladocola]
MTDTIDDILESFALLDDWEDRYRYVIELGRELPPYPEEARDDVHKVPGCVSQVWLLTKRGEGDDPVMTFQGDSDAHIVRGLVYILTTYYSGKRASEILDADIEKVLKTLGLDENLTPQRSNGLRSMVERIRLEASNTLHKQ